VSIDILKLAQESLFYEDLTLGEVWCTPSRTITTADIVTFAGLSADYNLVHIDDEYAKTTPYGERIAHGLLVLSILSGLVTRTLANQFMEKNLLGLVNIECRFPKPTLVGDTIRGEIELSDKRITSKSDRGIVAFKRRAINQRDEVVVDCEVKLMIRLREPNAR
jgi:acyl dehydratase